MVIINYEFIKHAFLLLITNYSLLIKLAGMVEMADTLDLGSRFWGFESLFPYNNASLFQLAEKTALNPVKSQFESGERYKIWVMSNQQ